MNIVGKVEICAIDSVMRNSWNPNHMTERMRASLRYGLENDGWLASQALLIWGADESGAEKNIIIDGEHRWRIASELGYSKAPMVFLHGIEEARAKALTIKLNQKRGEVNTDELGDLLRTIELELGELEVDDLGLDLGFDDNALMKLLADVPEELELADVGALPEPEDVEEEVAELADTEAPNSTTTSQPPPTEPSSKAQVALVSLFFDEVDHGEFKGMVARLGKQLGLSDTSAIVLDALDHRHGQLFG